MALTELDSSNFDKLVLKADKPVFVDFWAAWCGPCRAVAPVVEELAGEMPEVDFYKLNVDANPQYAAQYGVSSIPNMILFKDGAVVDRVIGAVPKEKIAGAIRKHLG